MAERIGVLTGTFDPVHLGHVALARAAMASGELGEVWFWVNPDASHKVDVTPYAQRLHMTELATDGEPGLSVYKGKLAKSPHRVGTFIELIKNQPGRDFVFVLGDDAIAELDRWEGFESIVERATFIVAQRPQRGQALEGLRKRLGVSGRHLRVQQAELERYAEISSRAIRDAIREGSEPEGLNPQVYRYIQVHKLYL